MTWLVTVSAVSKVCTGRPTCKDLRLEAAGIEPGAECSWFSSGEASLGSSDAGLGVCLDCTRAVVADQELLDVAHDVGAEGEVEVRREVETEISNGGVKSAGVRLY